MIQVTLKGGVVKEYEAGITAADVAKDLGMGLYKAACGCKVNGKVCDLRTPLSEDCHLAILTFDDEEGKKIFWHTSSHLLAQAVNSCSRRRSSPSDRRLKTVSITILTLRPRLQPKTSPKSRHR